MQCTMPSASAHDVRRQKKGCEQFASVGTSHAHYFPQDMILQLSVPVGFVADPIQFFTQSISALEHLARQACFRTV